MKYLSLFSGIGGFELGIQQAYDNTTIRPIQQVLQRPNDSRDSESWRRHTKPDCVGFSEIDKYAIATYQKHYPTHHNYGDITRINADELPDFDLLVGGFPCQAFSIAGKRKGFEDTRGTLFYDICRIAKAKQPMFMLLENVKGLVSHDGGKTLEVILENLQELGYTVNYEIRNSKDYGVPQNRERIFFTCKHIKGLINVGQNQKINTYDKIIQEYLFQLLLNNLVEVKKLQGHASKDCILGYLLLKEIKQNLEPSQLGNILGGISTPTEENIYQLKAEEVWQNIDMCLKNIWAFNLNDINTYTTSTALKQIIESKIYTYSTMLQAISLATVLLRKSSNHLWNEILSSLIVIQENTKYARINNENEEAIITESGTAHIKSELQENGQYFIIGHLRGTSRPKVFPFTESTGNDIEVIGDLSSETWTKRNESTRRVYGIDGVAPTIPTAQGGGVMAKIVIPRNRRTEFVESDISSTLTSHYRGAPDGDGRPGLKLAKAVLSPDRIEKRQNGRRMKEYGEPSFTLTSQDRHGVFNGDSIRRLTPTECERLQGFPDGWTIGSDTQRYKQCGNAVTVNVIKDIMVKLVHN